MGRYIYWMRFSLSVLAVGLIAGLGAIFFRELIAFFHNLFFYGKISLSYSALEHAAPSRWGIGVIFVPVIGSVAVAYLVKNFAPEAKGHGVPEVLDAIHYNDGVIRPIVALVKSVASSISIGSGGSVGREGPIIQIGAAFGSALGQWIKMRKSECIILIACGAGAGIAATFNTPIGGILFAIEMMLLELRATTIISISIATVVGTYVSYLFFGNIPFFPPLSYPAKTISLTAIIDCIILGVVLGIMATVFIVSIYYTEDSFDKIRKNYYIRHMLGMLFIGVSMYIMMYFFGHYYIQGVGYATVLDVLASTLTHPGFLLFLAALKLIETSITLGSGGSGGVFSPLLFIGATLGACIIIFCNHLFSGSVPISLQLGALAGMAGMIGAGTGAPITAIIMIVEMTKDVSIILPLIIAVAVASVVRRVFIKESIYTLKLKRRGRIFPNRNLFKIK